MKVVFKKNVVTVTKGASIEETIAFVEKRIAKREAEMKKREWIYNEYLALKSKCDADKSLLPWLKCQDPEKWLKG